MNLFLQLTHVNRLVVLLTAVVVIAAIYLWFRMRRRTPMSTRRRPKTLADLFHSADCLTARGRRAPRCDRITANPPYANKPTNRPEEPRR